MNLNRVQFNMYWIILTNLRQLFGIADSTVHKWLKSTNNNDGVINSRGSGNYSSDEAKEIARLKKELKDTQDALEVLKKAIGILGK